LSSNNYCIERFLTCFCASTSVGWASNIRLVRVQPMNLTAMPRLFASSLVRGVRDQTTSAWELNDDGLEGSLTTTRSLSPGFSGFRQLIKVPCRLIFSVSPSITPVAVTILAGDVIGILGCNRFSIPGVIVPSNSALGFP